MRFYRIDLFIAKKADAENKTKQQIEKEMEAVTGLSSFSIRRLRYAKTGDNTKVTSHLLALSHYFGCTMDELINQNAKDAVIVNNAL